MTGWLIVALIVLVAFEIGCGIELVRMDRARNREAAPIEVRR